MQTSTIIILIAVILVVAALLSLATSIFAFLPTRKYDIKNHAKEPLSIVVMVRDEIDFVKRNMPLILGQNYVYGFEIILVVNEGDSIADELMKKYADEP